MDWGDGLWGWIGGMDWRDVSKAWIKEMDWRNGQRIDQRVGQRDGQIKGWRDVVLLYLFYFRGKRNFRIFVENLFSRKANLGHFLGHFRKKRK
jgi:hypothetical protein